MADTKKVLIVEDDTLISSMYKIKLEQDGYAVVVANNGSEGLVKVKAEKPDIILLDIIMPQLDGFTVLEGMRGKLGIKAPIIMLTNLGTEEDRAKGEKLGATDYLVKSSVTPAQVSENVTKNLK